MSITIKVIHPDSAATYGIIYIVAKSKFSCVLVGSRGFIDTNAISIFEQYVPVVVAIDIAA